MKEMTDLLHQHPFVQGLDDAVIDFIAGCARNVLFQANQMILKQGESADWFYLVRRGAVALEMYAPGKGPITFLTVRDGEILGSTWLLPPYRWNYDARAVEVTRAIAFDAECLRGKCEADHHVGYEMMKRFLPPLIERLQAARMQSLDLYSAEAS